MKDEKINKGHWHELADRVHIIQENLEDHILQHPTVQNDPKLQKWVTKAQLYLGKIYNKAGRKL